MSDTQIVVPSSRVEEVRKIIFSLKLSEIQELFYKVPPLPPTKDVTIKVVRDPQNPKGKILQIKPDAVSITPKEQVAWTCPDGRLEVRFSRASNPFLGDMFEVARGGKAFSGTPTKRITKEQTFKYSILVTTPDGFFLTKEVQLVVTPASNPNAKRARQVTK
jgi:hypothetical protein